MTRPFYTYDAVTRDQIVSALETAHEQVSLDARYALTHRGANADALLALRGQLEAALEAMQAAEAVAHERYTVTRHDQPGAAA